MADNIKDLKEKDFKYNWVSTSRFLFYMTVICVVSSSIGGCYKLYQQRYTGKPDVEVQSSSKYTPEYKQ